MNWESPHVHPLDLTPDGSRLLAVNTAAAQLEVFATAGGLVEHQFSVPVGLDPVSVRARTNDEVWIVNHLSDSVSVVSLSQRSVVRSIETEDEPCDVVFAGTPQRAFVSASQVNEVQVFSLGGALVQTIDILGEDPRSLSVSADGTRVYAAVFESGNASTILGGGLTGGPVSHPKNVVSDPLGPYGGVNPPPNDGPNFDPPQKPGNPTPPRVGMIVKKDAAGNWMDDNGGDWTSLVSGPQADRSDRPIGWDLPDRDLAVIDASALTVQSYTTGLMNMCMAIGVNPASGDVVMVGTDATNEIRFEPLLNGTFIRVNSARINATGARQAVTDLNTHLDYTTSNVPQATRDLSIGDPRAVLFQPDGTR
ncbi:MAG: beta-propeller fold lactonase family protein, partial [Planctomycetota bacterium]